MSDTAADIADHIVSGTDLKRAETLFTVLWRQCDGYSNGEIACALAGAINALCDQDEEHGAFYLAALFSIATRQSIHSKN